ncbi:MAG TPA: aldo/keto reductase [Candidatus Solibacter sp.]|nr:aldo/keto reductase [Candidatus Solibacter sp.]
MRYRKLGSTGLQVSEIGFGAWGIGGKQWLGGRDDESLAALRRAIELGVNLIDTALAYGDGHSEQLVGQIVREARGAKIYVATKVPPKNRVWPAKGTLDEVFPYDYLIACAEESLRNLGLDAIDLLQLHVWSADWTPRDEWRRAFEDLRRAGKVRHIGISATEHDPESALSICETGLIDAVQVIYNIFDQTPERALFPLARKLDIGILARVPLDEGSLSGHFTDDIKFPEGDFRAWYFRGNRRREVVEHLKPLQRDLNGANIPDTALRFCLSHTAVSTVIPGMRSRKHVESNTALSDQGALDAATLATLKRHAWDRNYYT